MTDTKSKSPSLYDIAYQNPPPMSGGFSHRKTAADVEAQRVAESGDQGFGGDAVDAFQMGAGQSAAGMAETVHQITGSETAGKLRDATQNWAEGQMDQMSDSGREAMGKQFFSEDENGDVQFGEAWSDPESIGLQFSNMAGQLAGQVVTGFGFTGAVAKVGAKVVTKNLIKRGLAKGMTKEAAQEYAKSMIRSGAGVTGQALAGAGITGGQMGIQVRDEILNLSDTDLDESNEFRKLYYQLHQQNPNATVSELRKTATKTLADRVATSVQADPLTITANLTLDAIGGRYIDNLIRGVGTGRRLTNAGMQAIGQGIPEAAQGGMEQFNINRAMVNEGVDPDRDLMEGVATNALNEGVLGAGMGGAMGALTKGTPREKPSIQEQTSELTEGEPAQEENTQESYAQVQPMPPLEQAVEQVKAERGQYRGIDDDIRIAEQQGFEDEAVRLRAAKRNFQMAEEFANEGDTESAKRFNERALKIYREVTQMGQRDAEASEPKSQLPAEYVAIGEYLERTQLPEVTMERDGETYDEVEGLKPEVSDYDPDPSTLIPDSVDAPYYMGTTEEAKAARQQTERAMTEQQGQDPGNAPARMRPEDIEEIPVDEITIDQEPVPPVADVEELPGPDAPIEFERQEREQSGLAIQDYEPERGIDFTDNDRADELSDRVKDQIRKHKLPKGLDDGRLLRSHFRSILQNMSNELVPGGGVTYVRDKNDKVVSRTPSQNPMWFQDAPDEVKRLGVKGFKKTVAQALAGRKLGKGQARAVRYMLDHITSERNEYARDYARPEREDFVKFRKVMRGEMTPQEAGFADSDPVPQRYSDAIKRIASSGDQRFTDTDYEAVPGGNGVGHALADDIREALDSGLPENVVTEVAKQFGDDPVEFSLRLFVATEAHKNGQEITPASIVRAANQRALEKESADRGEEPEWVKGESEPEAEEELLTSYTEEDLRQKEADRQQAEKVSSETELKAQQKAKADAEVDSFALAGSNAETDQAAAAGQSDLLTESEKPKDVFSDSEYTNGKGVDFNDPELQKIIDHRVDVAKKEILEDINNGTIDVGKVSGWEDLDDFADANMYINDADRGEDRMVGPYGKRHGWRYNEFVDFTSRLIEEVDGWIRSGGLKQSEDETPAPAGVSRSRDSKKASEPKSKPAPKPTSDLPEILTATRKSYLKKMARKEGLKPSSPGYESAMQRIEDQYETDVDRAQAALSFDQFNELNSDSPEGLNRQAWSALREEYGGPEQTEQAAPENDDKPIIRNSAGNPYKNKGAARKALKKHPGYELVEVEGGFELHPVPEGAAEAGNSDVAYAPRASATEVNDDFGPDADYQSGAAREMTPDGRTADGRGIVAGDVFRTVTGRQTSPYPKQKSEKYASAWLIENAVAEAKSRGNDFAATLFANTSALKGGGLASADRDSMTQYLFDPESVASDVPGRASILKPLSRGNAPEVIPAAKLEEMIADKLNDREYADRSTIDLKVGGFFATKARSDFMMGLPAASIDSRSVFKDEYVAQRNESKKVDRKRIVDLIEKAQKKPKAEKPARPKVENKIFTEDAAEKARALLKKKLGQMNSGIDPEILQAGLTLAGYHIEKGARTFAAFAKAMTDDLGNVVKPYLKSWYMGVKYDPRAAEFEGLDSAGEVESADIETILEQGADDALYPAGSSESDSSDWSDATTEVEENISDERSGEGRQPAAQNGKGAGRGQYEPDSPVGGGRASSAGERSNQPVSVKKSGLEPSPSRDTDHPRSDSAGTGRLLAQHTGPREADARPAKTGKVVKPNKLGAASGGVSPAKISQIAERMPFLDAGQVEDVAFVERRLSKPDGYGVLLTNGTGTGKTFSGMGYVRRLLDQGKSNILIVTPSRAINDAWREAAKGFFDVAVEELPDTRSAGAGVVVTTFANFGANNTLFSRNWDAIVIDEAHKLSQNEDGKETSSLRNLRGLAMQPRSEYVRAEALHTDLYKKISDLRAAAKSIPEDLLEKSRKAVEEQRALIEGTSSKDRPRALMLSATPFAYEKNVRLGQGFLFDWGGDQDENGGYNSGGNYERFMMEHFGYRMRYNKLTEPDAKVDRNLLQRNFNSWLKSEGVLRGRTLETDYDYDRKFIRTENTLGHRVDEALKWLMESREKGARDLREVIVKGFDYHTRMYFLEGIKAQEAVPIIRKNLNAGRKVLIMHGFKKGGITNPFRQSTEDMPNEVASVYDEFSEEFSDLISAFSRLPSAIDTLKSAFPDLMIYNGDVSNKDRLAIKDRFNDDGDMAPMLAQGAAMREGVSLHDTTGNRQRVLLHLGMPSEPTATIQQEGRIYRVGQASDAMFRYLTIDTSWERFAFASRIAQRSGTAENLAMGEVARGLKESFIEAYEQADEFSISPEDGKGGKALDRSKAQQLTEWDKAKAYYYGTKKQGSGRSSAGREGTDYFATPEPVGLKMVEMANIRPGEDVLEPSGGHGAIARWFPDDTKNKAIEPSADLASKLSLRFSGDVMTGMFEDHHIVNKYDAIVMNPPYGRGGKTAADHVGKAGAHLRDGGRIVALVPTGPAADKQFEKLLGSEAMKDIHTVAEIKMPTVTFERAGTKVSTRILVLEKQIEKDAVNSLREADYDYSSVKSVDELFNQIEDLEIPDRIVSEKAPGVVTSVSVDPDSDLDDLGITTMDSTHSERGDPLFVVNMSGDMGDGYEALSKAAKKHNGYYIRARMRSYYKPNDGGKVEGTPTFTFPSEAERSAFLREIQSEGVLASLSDDVNEQIRSLASQFSGKSRVQTRSTAKQVRGWLEDMAEGMDSVEVVETSLDLPGRVKIDLGAYFDSADGAYDIKTGKTYIVAGNIRDQYHAKRVFLHEVVGHGGVINYLKQNEKLGGKAYLEMLDDIYYRAGHSVINKDIDRYAFDYDNPDERRIAVLEYIAHLAEKGKKMGLVQRVIAALRDLIRKFNPDIDWTDTDTLALIEKGRRHLQTTRSNGSDDGGVMASVGEGFVITEEQATSEGYDLDNIYYSGTMSGEKAGRIYAYGESFPGGGDNHFGGIFSSLDKGAAESHGDTLQRFVAKGAPADNQDLDDWDGFKEFIEEDISHTLNISTDEDIEWLYDAVVYEKNLMDYDTLERLGFDEYTGSWELQSIRGRWAKKLGYDVVEMDDEHGVSYLLVGDGVRRLADDGELSQQTPSQEQQSQVLARLSDDLAADSSLNDAEKAALSKIGPKGPVETAAEKVRGVMDGWRLKVRQGLVDRYAGLMELDKRLFDGNITSEENITRSAWVRAKMSNAASGAVSAMMNAGRIFMNKDGIVDVKKDTNGLIYTLNKLGSSAEIERFMGWIAGNRGEKLMAEGRENLFTPEDIQALKGLNRGELKDGGNRNALYEKVFKEFQQYRDDVLAIAEESGIITSENREMWANEFYVPFYRLDEDNDDTTGPRVMGGLSRQQAYKKLKGGTQNLNDLLQNTLMNFHHLVDASMKNMAAKQGIDNAVELGAAEKTVEAARDKKQSTFILRNGVKEWYDISDPMVYSSLTSLNHTGMNGYAMSAMRWFKRTFTNLTTSTPQFVVANLLRDSMSAVAVTDMSKNAAGNIAQGLKSFGLLDRHSYERARLMASGGAFSFGHVYGEDADSIRYQIDGQMRRARVIKDPKQLLSLGLKPLQAGWDRWQDVNNSLENVNRAAAFKQAEEAGKGTMYAAFQARDLMDFSAHGAWPAVRFLIDVVPFLNARLQGLDKLYRSGVKPSTKVVLQTLGVGNIETSIEEKKAAARFSAVVGALSVATMTLFAHNQDDEEYRKAPDWLKDSYWWFRIPETDHVITIPKPFEVGAIATVTERLLEQGMNDEATGKLFRERMWHMLTGTFAFSAVPQMFQPALDVYANKDSFTGRQIETMGQSRLSKSNRTDEGTTGAAKMLSKVTTGVFGEDSNYALSPVQMDFLIGGYLGQIGAWVSAIPDVAIRQFSDTEKPSVFLTEYQPIKRFYRDASRPAYTKDAELFYDSLRKADRLYADMRKYREEGDMEEYADTLRENRDLLGMRKMMNQVNRRLQEIRNRIKAIEKNGSLSAEEKRRQIDLLKLRRNHLIERVSPKLKAIDA